MNLTRRMIILTAFVLILALPSLAQDDMQPITLNFAAMVGDDMAMCGMSYEGIGADDAEVSFNDFRFYVSNIQLITAEGDSVALELMQDEMWQVENVALLDFEDGTGGCSEIGNAAVNSMVMGMAPAGEYVGLSFDLGVPFELNHLDVTAAPSPLNIAGMWWSWQGGYKFIRLDLMTDAVENSPYNVHIGSTGCDSAAGVIPPAEPCARPNLTTITFDEFDFENQVIVADLAGLLEGVALYDNVLMPPGCMAGFDDPDCPDVYAGFGLSLETGACVEEGCMTQTLFRVADVDGVMLVGRTDMTMDMNMDMGGDHGGHDGHGGDGDDSEDDDHSGHGG
jgi:uncharacterized repeat protein (TIGR04052 family)